MVTDAEDGIAPLEPISFEVRAMHGFHYAIAEVFGDFGEFFVVVSLFKTKKDYFSSEFVKTSRVSAIIAAFGKDASLSLSEYENGQLAKDSDSLAMAAGMIFSDTLSLSSMLNTIYNYRDIPSVFEVASVNSRIVDLFSPASLTDYTDCSIINESDKSEYGVNFFVTKRDLGNYTDMILALICTLSFASVSRKITVLTECFDGCARIIIATDVSDPTLLSFASSDLGALSKLIPHSDFRLLKAEYIAASSGVSIYANGSQNDSTFAFSLVIADENELPTEFRHGNPISDIEKHFAAAVRNNFPYRKH